MLLFVTPASAQNARSGRTPLEWRWQRFRVWEYPLTVAALGAATYLRAFGDPPAADWKGGVLMDDWIQEHTAIQSIPQRSRVATMTDLFFYGSMAYRLVDSALIPSIVWRSPDVALQMSMIDLESFGFLAIALWGSQALYGRERPLVDRCADPRFAAAEGACDRDGQERNRSFFAGHPAVVLTAAGLTCMHHSHLPLYGGGAADTLACGTMLGAAALTGAGRVVTEKHHASDLLVGYAFGGIAGWLLPGLLHYRRSGASVARAGTASVATVRASVVPQIGPDALGVSLHGIF
jgi:membrane-associated phospholipid phosphatase